MSQDNSNQKNEQGGQGPVRLNLGQFPQGQNQNAQGQFLPNQYPNTPSNTGFSPGQQNQAPQQTQWSPSSPYGQNQQQQQQPYNPAASQQGHGQQNTQDVYSQAAGNQSVYSQAAQNQGAYGQNQYPTGYAQAGQQQQTQGFQSYGGNEYISYDQKAGKFFGVLLGLGLLALVIFGLVMGYKITHPAPVLAPTAFTQFTVNDNGFSIAQPVGWQTDSGGSNGVESNATFRSGKAKIYADSDLGGSLNGDMLNAANAQRQEAADQLGQKIVTTPPVITLHREAEAKVSQNYANYQEQPMQQFSCDLGTGWYSEFTGNAGMITGNIHGYRATVLDNDRRVSVETVCRESDWPALQPVFMHELQSLARGQKAQ